MSSEGIFQTTGLEIHLMIRRLHLYIQSLITSTWLQLHLYIKKNDNGDKIALSLWWTADVKKSGYWWDQLATHPNGSVSTLGSDPITSQREGGRAASVNGGEVDLMTSSSSSSSSSSCQRRRGRPWWWATDRQSERSLDLPSVRPSTRAGLCAASIVLPNHSWQPKAKYYLKYKIINKQDKDL